MLSTTIRELDIMKQIFKIADEVEVKCIIVDRVDIVVEDGINPCNRLEDSYRIRRRCMDIIHNKYRVSVLDADIHIHLINSVWLWEKLA